MGKSPFKDAIEVLEEIRAFCERREKSYEGWGSSTPDSTRVDLKQIHEKADRAIKALTPGSSEPADSSEPVRDNSLRLTVSGSDGEKITYRGTFE